MKSILLQLFDGQINPGEQYYPKTEEYRKLTRAYVDRCETFINQLKKCSPSLAVEFNNILDHHLDVIPFETEEIFIDGFCLGARMMIEVCQKNLSN